MLPSLTLRHEWAAGASTWPGANMLMLEDGTKFVLRFTDRRRFMAELKVQSSPHTRH